MSVRAADAALAEVSAPAWARSPESLTLRLVAFFGLAAFASLQYMTLLVHPPGARVLAVAAVATAAAGGLALTARIPVPALVALVLRVLLLLLMLVLGLLAIGIPAHLLTPGRWPALGRDLRHGFGGLAGWLWPYRGEDGWSRLTVLVVLPVGLLSAAGVSFWPSRRESQMRRLVALGVLVAIFLGGVANQKGTAWRVQGLALVILVAAWLWLPRMRPADFNRAGRWLLACALLALAVAPVLSARGSWIDYRAWNPVGVTATFQWNQTYGPIPWSRSTATMFEIAEPHPGLLRVTALDQFDGVRFRRSGAPPGSPGLDLGDPAIAGRWYQRATVTVAGLRSNLLVSGGGVPVAVDWLGARRPTAIGQPDGTAVLSPAPSAGDRYSVLSYDPAPGAGVLRSLSGRFPEAYMPYTRFALPGAGATAVVGAPAPGATPASDPALARRIAASPYGPMFALARTLAAGAPSSYDVAGRIERYLLRGYTYDERPPRRRYPLEAFLFRDRRGYCQQFSGAMTLMLRMDGIPARVAAGFRGGVFDAATGAWQVRAVDAHSWVEVYFQGIGWVPFDPTPPRAVAIPGGASAATQRDPLQGGLSRVGAGSGRRPSFSAASVRRPAAGGVPAWLLGAGALALALALGGAVWLAVGARRLREALAGDASGAVAELEAALGRLGYPLEPGATLTQLERRLEPLRGDAASGYVRLLRERRFGARPSAGPTRRERRALRRALARDGGVRARLRALAALPPGTARRVRAPGAGPGAYAAPQERPGSRARRVRPAS